MLWLLQPVVSNVNVCCAVAAVLLAIRQCQQDVTFNIYQPLIVPTMIHALIASRTHRYVNVFFTTFIPPFP